jgi:hypothetical protein
MEEANPGIPLGHVKRKVSTNVPPSKRKHEGDHDHLSEGVSTPGTGGEKRYKDTKTPISDTTLNQQAAGPSSAPSHTQTQSQAQTQAPAQGMPSSNYDFFFPDLEAMANGRYQPPQSTGAPFNPYAYNNPPNQYQVPNYPSQGWGMGMGQGQGHGQGQGFEQGQMPYGMGMGMGFGPNSQNQANFTGFGLTMPAPPVTPNNGGGGGGGGAYPSNPQASASTSTSTAVPMARSATAPGQSNEVESETEKSNRLKEAVASLTVGDRRALEGTPMTPDEMAERFRVQEKLMSSLPENDQNNRMLEAMQVSWLLVVDKSSS